MNNANCYALEAKAKYIYDSDEQEQYQFHGANIVRTQKSMSMMSSKQAKPSKQSDMKKSNSFLLLKKTPAQSNPNKTAIESKDKSKTSKKCLNVEEVRKKPPINSKNSMTKTSVSIGNVSTKSIKPSKNRSISRDYLILDSQIYQCQNIEQINEKLICGNSPMYSHQRFIKATMKNQQKIQAYMLSFLQQIKYSKKGKVNVNRMSPEQKKKLYLLLKSQTSIKTRAKTQQKSFSMESLIKEAYKKIEQKTSQTIIQSPSHEQEVKKWKNIKLHQLMEIHSCFKENEESSERIFQTSFKIDLKQEEPVHQKITNQDNGMVNGHLVNEKYPNRLSIKTIEKKQMGSYLDSGHILSRAGIQKFMQDLWDYLVDSGLVGQLISNIRHPYGLSRKQKTRLMKQDSAQYAHALLLQRQNSPILHNQIFINFCKSTHKSNNTFSPQQQRSQIIFHKAIFDTLNTQLGKFQPDFPYGCFHPLEDNPSNSAYLIDQENAMLVWDECIGNIIAYDGLLMGSLSQGQGDQMEKQIREHNNTAFQHMQKLEGLMHDWDLIKPLTTRQVYQEISRTVQKQLLKELIKQLSIF